ncbi:restriction endonuclease subunit S [Streptomyces sp. NPDC017941]|uniref:restriction endonuclease subunit S n=1 Tax=Streptomyces sp. NPDC017941 TaxID=3365018 RepID=UPI0037964613
MKTPTANWPSFRIKHLAQVSYGLGQPPRLSESGIPILRATNINRGKISETGLIYSSLKDLPLDRAPLLRSGEILVVRSGAYTGDSALITDEWAGSAPGYDLRITPARVEPRYLAYCLLSSAVMQQMDIAKGRAAQPHLNAEELGEVTVNLPELSEQRRIAQFLDAETGRVERLISLQRKIVIRLEEREAAQLDTAIDEQIALSGVVPLRRFLWGVDQGTSPQCDAVPAGEDEWGVLKVSCLRPGEFLAHENKRLPISEQPMGRSEVHEGDLLITRANTPQLVGSTAVVPKVRSKLLLSDKIFRIRLRNGLDPEYVATVARGTRIRSLCSATSNGASQSMANIRFDEVKAWPIPVADLSEQRDFINKANRTHEKVNTLRSTITRQIDLLAERRQALITAAVTGQIDVSTASGRGIEE